MYEGPDVLFEFKEDTTTRVISEPSVDWSITVVDIEGRESGHTAFLGRYIAPPGGVGIYITIERLDR